jgi:hypothetical protein
VTVYTVVTYKTELAGEKWNKPGAAGSLQAGSLQAGSLQAGSSQVGRQFEGRQVGT